MIQFLHLRNSSSFFKTAILFFITLSFFSCSNTYIRTPELFSYSNFKDHEKLKNMKIAIAINFIEEDKEDSGLLEKIAHEIYLQFKSKGIHTLSTQEFSSLMEKNKFTQEDLFDSKINKQFIQKLNIDTILLIHYAKESDVPQENPYIFIGTPQETFVVHQKNLSFKIIELSTGKLIGIHNFIKIPDEIIFRHKSQHFLKILLYGTGGLISFEYFFVGLPLIATVYIINNKNYIIYQYNGDGFDQNVIFNKLNHWLNLQIPFQTIKTQKEITPDEKEIKHTPKTKEESQNDKNIQIKF